MGQIVNLQRAKKRLLRDVDKLAAAENRARHGRTAVQKANDARAEQRRRDALDGKKCPEPGEAVSPPPKPV
jgi:hypothetical protein